MLISTVNWDKYSATTLNLDKNSVNSALFCPKLSKIDLFQVLCQAPDLSDSQFFLRKCYVNVSMSIFGVLWLIFISQS